MAVNLDSKLRKDGKLFRSNSFSKFGIDLASYIPVGHQRDRQVVRIKKFQEKFTKMLRSKFRELQYVRTDAYRPLIDIVSALEGTPECFIGSERRKRMPLQIGINISARFDTAQYTSDMRIAAVLAVVQLCKLRGQQTNITMVYGNCPDPAKVGKVGGSKSRNHYRIRLSKNMTLGTMLALGNLTIRQEFWQHQRSHDETKTIAYHISQLEKLGFKEFDFCLDRLELTHNEEEERIIKSLGVFGVK